MIPTNAQASDIDDVPKPDKVMILYLGQKAPMSGVLLDEDQFRFYKTLELENEMLQKHVEKPATVGGYVLTLFGGIILGVLGAQIIR